MNTVEEKLDKYLIDMYLLDMSKASRTRFALLGALSSGEKSGYDLKQEFESRMSYFWSESLGQIYPTLHRLHREKLVSGRTDRVGGRVKTLYRLTRAGRRELGAWLETPAEPESVRNELLLKLFFGPQLGSEGAIRQLEASERRWIASRSRFVEMERQIEAQAVPEEQKIFWRLTLSAGVEVTDARIRWCRKALRRLRALQNAPPGTTTRRTTG